MRGHDRVAHLARADLRACLRTRCRPCAGPTASTACTADSMRSAASGWLREKRSIMAADRIVASGLATPLPAMSGALPWLGSYRPLLLRVQRGRRQHADRAGEHRRLVRQDVAEHVAGDDDVELLRRLAPAASRRCRRTCGRVRRRGTARATSVTTSFQNWKVSSTLALSTLVTLACCACAPPGRRRGRCARSPGACSASCRRPPRRRGSAPSGRGAAAARLAEVDVAGELADDQDVEARRPARASGSTRAVSCS